MSSLTSLLEQGIYYILYYKSSDPNKCSEAEYRKFDDLIRTAHQVPILYLQKWEELTKEQKKAVLQLVQKSPAILDLISKEVFYSESVYQLIYELTTVTAWNRKLAMYNITSKELIFKGQQLRQQQQQSQQGQQQGQARVYNDPYNNNKLQDMYQEQLRLRMIQQGQQPIYQQGQQPQIPVYQGQGQQQIPTYQPQQQQPQQPIYQQPQPPITTQQSPMYQQQQQQPIYQQQQQQPVYQQQPMQSEVSIKDKKIKSEFKHEPVPDYTTGASPTVDRPMPAMPSRQFLPPVQSVLGSGGVSVGVSGASLGNPNGGRAQNILGSPSGPQDCGVGQI